MTFTRVILALACLMSGPLAAQEAMVAELLSKDLTNLPGKEGLMITVEYPPGSSDPIHRHKAHAFVYVLEGSVVMQVRGGKQVTLTPGQTFIEGLPRCQCHLLSASHLQHNGALQNVDKRSEEHTSE